VGQRLAFFIDYQNVHLIGHGRFAPPGTPVHRTVVHPLLLAERLAGKRREQGDVELVRVFRGRPNPEWQPVLASVNDAQTDNWERDPRVSVLRRDLNYRGWPALPPQEKGVDVALAVDLIETALLGQYDDGIVFSCDTDLLPAIEVAFRRTPPRIEIASWRGARPLWFPEGLASTPRRYLPFCHFLDADDFGAVRDRTQYRAGP
jgi:hypothetical protein